MSIHLWMTPLLLPMALSNIYYQTALGSQVKSWLDTYLSKLRRSDLDRELGLV